MLSTQDDAAWRPGVNREFVLRLLRAEEQFGSEDTRDWSEAFTKQIGHLDEKGAPVPAKARLELISKGTEAVATEVVVVSDIESRSRIRRPTKQKLPFDV